MSTTVLARTWRPQTFKDLVGQSLVVEALQNSFKKKRTHHAYLFTGTRGVGKTTLARIIAQCFNCEKGITHEPCGTCIHCQALQHNHMVDFIEIDAASRTKVEDTRDVLENVQYPPAQGRFKIYLIDEVHMLSNHSFNALLKTLEEPPAHVIFILATTDPQKLPSTVLSRCLQLHLKPIPTPDIEAHLLHILQAETIACDKEAMHLIAKAADGSLRDALSLLEQSIALSGESITQETVEKQLGLIPNQALHPLASAILSRKPSLAFDQLQALMAGSIDCEQVLMQLQKIWHELAVATTLETAAPIALDTIEGWSTMTRGAQCEQAQLLYQIATLSRKDFPYTPTPQLGLEMAVLRMASFKPAAAKTNQTSIKTVHASLPPTKAKTTPTPTTHEVTKTGRIDAENWGKVLADLPLGGMVKALFNHCSFLKCDGETLTLYIEEKQRSIINPHAMTKLTESLKKQGLAEKVELQSESAAPVSKAPIVAAKEQAKRAREHKEQTLHQDPTVQSLTEAFSGTITHTKPAEEIVSS